MECEARHSGSIAFRGEKVADMKVEARNARMIPPPPISI